MKIYVLIMMTMLLSVSCNGQKDEVKKNDTTDNKKSAIQDPKGNWKVDKEFDENGNLIKYDSIYSWSYDSKIDTLSSQNKDSLIQSFKSRFFTNFSEFENKKFEDIFSQDSLFMNHFFNDDFLDSDFGDEFMDIDKIRQQILKHQKSFLEKYQSELSTPKNEN